MRPGNQQRVNSTVFIDGPDNRKGGERLNEMFTLNRVLDGDPFHMKITH